MLRRVRFDDRGEPTSETVVTRSAVMTTAPTVRAVVALAAELRARAARRLAQDPFARPYGPSEAAARRLSQRYGSEKALMLLRGRALEAERRDQERDVESQRSLERLAQHRAAFERRRAKARERLTFGRRIDLALAALETVSGVPAATTGGAVVHGGEPDHAPPVVGDPVGRARGIAKWAAQEIEAELDAARLRDLKAVA
jgi:hypothetical protein